MEGLKKIRVRPVAFESFGVRSMCTYVETPDIKVLLDAGVSLGPSRYGFPPHPREYEALRTRRNLILEIADKADAVTVSHYHFDHHTPAYTDWAHLWSSAETAQRIYGGKLVLAKSYRSLVNFSQRRRGWMFTETISSYAEKLEVADGRSFNFGDTNISFSAPFFHGPEGSRLGWVIMAAVRCGEEKMLFAPDVQGPICEGTVKAILAEQPQLIVVGGPPLYLADFAVSREEIDIALRNLGAIVKQVPATVVDHHLLRDENWKESAQPVFDAASRAGHRLVTAAEFLGESNNMLESRRKALYENEPPSQEFMKWARMSVQKRRLVQPPI